MFWTAGEWVRLASLVALDFTDFMQSPFHPNDLNLCNCSLTTANGSATELLEHHETICEE